MEAPSNWEHLRGWATTFFFLIENFGNGKYEIPFELPDAENFKV